MSCSGIAVKRAPVKKLPSVRICKSPESFDMGNKYLEFKHASICDNNVENYSSVSSEFPIVYADDIFVVLCLSLTAHLNVEQKGN